MITKFKNVETSELEITYVVEENQWKEEQEKAFKQLKENLEIKGFRKGLAPDSIVKKSISSKEIWTRALKNGLEKWVVLVNKELKEKDKVLDRPVYDIVKITDTELEIKFIYPIYPEFSIPNYKKLGIELDDINVSDEFVNSEIKVLQKKHSLLKKVSNDAKIENGSVVTFSFEGFFAKDDKPFEGGKSDSYTLEIGSKQFIPGFEDQMIGLAKNDEKKIELSFPENYHVEELKGQPVYFKIKIIEIKSIELPELNQDFFKELGFKDIETAEEFKEKMKNLISDEKKLMNKNKYHQKFLDKMAKEVKINISKFLIQNEMDSLKEKISQDLEKQNIKLEQYLKMVNISNEDFEKDLLNQANLRLISVFLFAEISRLEKIEATEKDYEEQYAKLSKFYNKSIEELKKIIPMGQLQVQILNDKILDFLIENN